LSRAIRRAFIGFVQRNVQRNAQHFTASPIRDARFSDSPKCIYAERKIADEKSSWSGCGRARQPADGQGFSLCFTLVPVGEADIDNGRRQAAVKGTANELDLFPVVKLFNSCDAATWPLTEIDPEDADVA
jgi:hypothetical protein